MDTFSPYRVRQCSKCHTRDTEFICTSCKFELCSSCKEEHVLDINTLDHDVMIYRRKMTTEMLISDDTVNDKYCETCELPISPSSLEHNEHKKLDIKTAYGSHHQRIKNTIQVIRALIHLYQRVLLTGIKADAKTCRKKICKIHASLISKATGVKDIVDKVLCDVEFKHRCYKQNLKLNRHISSLECSEHLFEQSTKKPIHFLLSKSVFRSFHEQYECVKHTELIANERFVAKDVMMLLNEVKVTEGEKRPTEYEQPLQLLPAPVLQKYFTATDVDFCSHMAVIASDRIWIGCNNNFYLKDTKGDTLFHQEGPYNELTVYYTGALFTVNNEKELIFINRLYNIVKLSHDMEKITTLIKTKYNNKGPCCVYFAPFAGDLLVGFIGYNGFFNKAWVNRYDLSGQKKQTIQYNETGYPLFSHPSYMTENNNGDVVISDGYTVVVTDSGGKHRFSYEGHPMHFGMFQGICTDELSNILVCDSYKCSVLMIDKDGNFLTHLLMRPPGILSPISISIDENTHLLWVGSSSLNTVHGYRYITRYHSTDAESSVTDDVRKSFINSPVKKREERCFVKDPLCLAGPLLLNRCKVSEVKFCSHFSLVSADKLWVSDDENLVLKTLTGKTIHHLKNVLSEHYYGTHTVTGDGELIYVNKDYNIMKISTVTKTETKFLTSPDSTMRPVSVYCSPSTGELLVGMTKENPRIGIIMHYNRDGEETKHNNSDLTLYSMPAYITENGNGDIVVSDADLNNVVVTDSRGRHRFSYTTQSPHSYRQFYGVCCDGLLNILICNSSSVHVIDRNGHFLSHLQLSGMGGICLCYDVPTYRLYAGFFYCETLSVYKYISKQDSPKDQESSSCAFSKPTGAIQTTETKEGIIVRKSNHSLAQDDPVLYKYLSLTGVRCSYNVSIVASDKIWVSDDRNLVLNNETGEPLYAIYDFYDISNNGYVSVGLHTVNSDGELIYIAKDDNILKLSNDLKTSTVFIEKTDTYKWKPKCLYHSLFTGDILVGMTNVHLCRAKIYRYQATGEIAQTIQCNENGHDMLRSPRFITENKNEDIVISDYGAVVVTDQAGKFRYSYTGYPQGTAVDPLGVCTDALSHILVSDYYTSTIQVIDKDGQFLSYIHVQCLSTPCCIFFDKNTHLLWVGSDVNNTVAIYRYLRSGDKLEDLNGHCNDERQLYNDVDETSSHNQIYVPVIQKYFTVTNFTRSSHISCGISDFLLINEGNNFIVTNTSGKTLYHIDDLRSDPYIGSHSMNISQEELFYINKEYNIVKLSKFNRITKTVFVKYIQETDSTWRPWCVFCSLLTEDVLVGMKKHDRLQGKVIRYNNTGFPNQKIQYDETGCDIYRTPRYITENNNGDVVVSDSTGAVVVTNREGGHRFSYKGHPSGSVLSPLGICTDSLSHILICDKLTQAIQIIDKDGQFLSNLMVKPPGIVSPSCLCYDFKTDLLWVGSGVNYSVCLYKYLTKQQALTVTDECQKYVAGSEECCLVQANI